MPCRNRFRRHVRTAAARQPRSDALSKRKPAIPWLQNQKHHGAQVCMQAGCSHVIASSWAALTCSLVNSTFMFMMCTERNRTVGCHADGKSPGPCRWHRHARLRIRPYRSAGVCVSTHLASRQGTSSPSNQIRPSRSAIGTMHAPLSKSSDIKPAK